MIIVTGGAGFIGSCIAARLNALGRQDLIIVDHLDDRGAKQRNLDVRKYKKYCDKAEFLDRILSDDLPDGVEALIHMGACSSTTGKDERYYRENNYEYSCHLARWAVGRGVRFIYASSAATYGDGKHGYSDDDATTRKLKPLNLYGQSKQNFDLWILDKGYEKKVVGLKFFNVFGPNEYHKGDMRSVIAKAWPQVKSEGRMRLFKSYRRDVADGEQRRDFIYVKDAVDIVMHFWENPGKNGIFNAGTGQARSWNDLARALFAAAGSEPKIEYVEMPEDIRPRYQYFTEAKVDKLRKSGFAKPFTSLEDAVRDYAGYLKNGRYL